jgi:hypothetical protein
MERTITKRYLCAVCKQNEIRHETTEDTYEGSVPDQSNCDLSSYSNSRVSGGRLFKNRPTTKTDSLYFKPMADEKTPPGGICSGCLENETVKSIIAANAIIFDDEPETFRIYT